MDATTTFQIDWTTTKSLLDVHGHQYAPGENIKVFDLSQVKAKRSRFRKAPRDSDWTNKSNWKKNARGDGLWLFTAPATDYFLHRNDLLTIIRGHQQKDGYEIAGNSKFQTFPRLITVFSAPNYVDASLASGGLAQFTHDGKLFLRAYSWNHHPVYHGRIHVTNQMIKHFIFEDFVMFLHAHAPEILSSVTLHHYQSKSEVRNFLAAMKERGRNHIMGDLESSSTDWDFLANNLTEGLKSISDLHVHKLLYAERTQNRDGVLWFEGFDYLAGSLLREAVHEMEEITLESDLDPFHATAFADHEPESASDSCSAL